VTSAGRAHPPSPGFGGTGGTRLQKTARFVFFACSELVEGVIFEVEKALWKAGTPARRAGLQAIGVYPC